jgi:tRNA pseudouridine38-40 synthase
MNQRNIRLILQYDGTDYIGWQRQPAYRGCSIQETVEKALARTLYHPVSLDASGRTDAGVHAFAQVANFRTENPIPCPGLFLSLNHLLPPDILVREASEAEPDFHARLLARAKTYRYCLCQGRLPLWDRRWAWDLGKKLDLELMQKAAVSFIGEHDFRSFTVSSCRAKSFSRRIESIRIWKPEEDKNEMPWKIFPGTLLIEVTGSGFLQKMVRLMVARLVAIGKKELPPEAIAEYLAGKRQTPAPPAPPQGLMLWEVRY